MQRPKLGMTLLALIFGTVGNVRGSVILDFQDILIPGGTDVTVFSPYTSQGFTLTSTTGFQAHGPNSIFYAGATGLAAFAPAAPPDALIELTKTDGTTFSLVSIDLARNFPFDPAPTVSFTGTLFGGGTVTQSFTVTTPVGVSAFQSFSFTGFEDVVSVTWGQPVLSEGLHQFTDITIATPEPSTLVVSSILFGMFGLVWSRTRLNQRAAAA